MSGHKGQIVGYVRVRAIDQNEARQVAAIGEVDRLFMEKVSGKNIDDRAELKEMLAYVRAGDVIRVKSPDRLSRSTRDLLDLVEQVKAKGAAVEFLENPALNTNTPQGEFMLTVLAAIAQLERATIRERQAEDIAIAKAKGVYQRGPKLTDDQVADAAQQIEAGVPKAKVARELGVSRQTLYTALASKGRYEQPRSPANTNH